MTTNEYTEELKQYQATLEEQLRAPDGWLTLVGLHWLKEGENSVGSDPDADIPLPEGAAPVNAGSLSMSEDRITFSAAPGVQAVVDGKPIRSEILLESDLNRNQTIVQLGNINFYLVLRGTRYGIRVRYENNPDRINFEGRVWWPVNPSWRVEAKIKYHEPQKIVKVPDALGNVNETAMDCALVFEAGGNQFKLDAFKLPSGQFYILFMDQSSQNGSYPAGRFLITEHPEGERVVIDFNKAYNPPCAFTVYATCPLPPENNHLDVEIQAGERFRPMPGH